MKNLLMCFTLLFGGVAAAADAKPSPTLVVSAPYSHPTAAPGVPGVGFFTLSNNAKKADRLLSVESPAAGRVEIHQSKVVNGVMQMRALTGGLALPPGKTVEFTPGGLHLMLFALREPSVEGGSIPLVLRFERAGRIEAQLKVLPREALSDAAPAEDHSQHQH